jgi:CheY-like chemotaxis protein
MSQGKILPASTATEGSNPLLRMTSLSISTILVIEADPSLRRLITLGLCHSGMHVIAVSSIQELPALDTQTLDLLVVDVDQGVKSDWSLLSALREQPQLATLPIIALSWESSTEDRVSLPTSLFSSLPFLSSRRTFGQAQGTASALSSSSSPLRNVTNLSKPFDARALHTTIAELLEERAAQKAAQVAIVEARVLASYEQRVAPSIWPAATAAGMLLVVIGFLLHFIIVIVGAALILTSLLLWMLDTKPTSSVLPPTMLSSPAAHS